MFPCHSQPFWGWRRKRMVDFGQQMVTDVLVILLSAVLLFLAVKKSRKAQRPLKKQVSSPNFQLKDKAVKVSQKL